MTSKEIIKHPVWSKVIASLLTAAILFSVKFIPGFYGSVWSGIKITGNWLMASTGVKNWFLILMSIFAIATIIRLASRLLHNSEYQDTLTEVDYRQDYFWEILWRWRYGKRDIYQVVSFCPLCDMQIYAKREYGDMIYNKPEGSSFECDHCHQFRKVIPINIRNIEHTVIRNIQRKLRTGEWQEAIKNKTV